MPNNWTVDDIHELANDILLQSQGGDVSPDLSGYVGVYITGIDKEAFATGNPIEIHSDINQIPKIKLLIVPKQEGSGTPSPTNVRPITGWTGVNLSVNGESVPISFGEAGTVYGGTVDVTTGLLTVTHTCINCGGAVQYNQNNGYKAYQIYNLPKSKSQSQGGISNMLSLFGSFSSASMNRNIAQLPTTGAMFFALDETADASKLNICYELAESATYQLTPTEVNLIVGENVISTDSPNTLEVTYKIRS